MSARAPLAVECRFDTRDPVPSARLLRRWASAALGAVFAIAMNYIFPGAQLSPAAFALVAMGAVFGAASRATASSFLPFTPPFLFCSSIIISTLGLNAIEWV